MDKMEVFIIGEASYILRLLISLLTQFPSVHGSLEEISSYVI